MSANEACFLVTHGSRAPRSFKQLQELVASAKNNNPQKLIGGGCLEGLAPSLAEQLEEFGETALHLGYDQIKVIPIFLLPGVHVCQDLPEQIELANRSSLKFHLTDYFGNHPRIPQILAEQFSDFPNHRRILISHGSKLTGGNLSFEDLAAKLNALTAYWSMSPSLEDRILNLTEQGINQICIVPYFLFAGGITEAIASQISSFPGVKLADLPFSPAQVAQMSLEI
jgi:sirohydrochlorin cobaltochelatase